MIACLSGKAVPAAVLLLSRMVRRSRRLALVTAMLLGLGACGGTSEGQNPTPLFVVDGQADSLALDEDRVYVCVTLSSGVGQIVAAPKEGGESTVVAEVPVLTLDLAVDEASVYFTLMGGGPYVVPKQGGELRLVGTTMEQPWGVALDAEYVYWVTWVRSDEDLGLIARAGKNGEETVALTGDQFSPLRLAVDSTHVYWTNGGTEGGELRKVPKAGGDVVTLATGASSNGFIALDETNVYFTTAVGSELMVVPKAGGPATVLALPDVNARELAADASHVYASGNDGIYKVASDGSDVELLAGTTPAHNDLAIDAEHVYWIGPERGIYRAPK
jgi:hypothetical protein